MIDKNIILNQQQPSITISNYNVKDKDFLVNSTNLKIDVDDNLLSNGKKYTRTIISNLLEYFNTPFVKVSADTPYSSNTKFFIRKLEDEKNYSQNPASKTGYQIYKYYYVGSGSEGRKAYAISSLYQEQLNKTSSNSSPLINYNGVPVSEEDNIRKTAWYMSGLPSTANIYFSWSGWGNSVVFDENHTYQKISVAAPCYPENSYNHSLNILSNSFWDDSSLPAHYSRAFYFNSGEERFKRLELLYNNLVNNDAPFFPYWNGTAWVTALPTNSTYSDDQKRKIKYLNYFIFCIQHDLKYGSSKSQFPTWTDYRARINKEKNIINLKLMGNFNINLKSLLKINIIFYKQDSQNPIGNIEFTGEAFNNNMKMSGTNYFFEIDYSNEKLKLKKNRTYKVLLELTYKNGEKTKTNYGIITTAAEEKESNIQIDSKTLDIKITSSEAFPSYIKKNPDQNNKYQFININNLKEQNIYYKGEILNPYLGGEDNSTGLDLMKKTIYSSNDSSNAILYYVPKIKSDYFSNGYNCCLLNGLNMNTAKTNSFHMIIPYISNSIYGGSQMLLIPRKTFDFSNNGIFYNKTFNFSIDQAYLLERNGLERYCTPWLCVIPFRKVNTENGDNMDNITLAFKEYLRKIVGDFHQISENNSEFFPTLAYLSNSLSYSSYSSDPVNLVGFLDKKFIVRNNNYFYDPITKETVTGSISNIELSQYFYSGLSIGTQHYIPSIEKYTFHPNIIQFDNLNQYQYYNDKRLSLDFNLTSKDEFILVNIFSEDVDSYRIESNNENDRKKEYNQKSLNRIKSIRIVPKDENIINSRQYAYPVEAKKYYIYEDKFKNIPSNTTTYEVEAIMSNSEILKQSIVLNQTSAPQMPNFTAAKQPLTYDFINSNYEKGYIELKISNNSGNLNQSQNDTVKNLNFKILRKKENSELYEEIGIIKGASLYSLNTNKSYLIKDYGVEQGYKYNYYLEPFNDTTIYAKKTIGSQKFDFNHMVLIDSEKSFIIKFNPKVSTYKTVQLETKIDTIGNQYPFIRKNGNIQYKQFNLGGLISIEAEDQIDIGRTETWALTENYNEKDIVFDERIYKNNLLDWLNNGKYKLLKTPTEGNYIVQLMNVNLTPMEQLGRLLHSFTCDAYEVMEYTQENLNNNLHLNETQIELI